MTRSWIGRAIIWTLSCFLISSLLIWPSSLQADIAQYFYDELGRLVGVMDGQGSVAVYTYDEVGNLVSIQRFTSSGGGSTGNIGIFFLTPTSGLVGATVQIQGFGFSPTASNNQVNFNGTTATVSSATANSITTSVPSGATTGPITVTNTNGTATSPQPFTVLVPPIITGVNPARVPQGQTTQVQIAGLNLVNILSVNFSNPNLSATILAGATAENLPINLAVPLSVPPGTYTFLVTNAVGTAQSGAVTVTVAPPRPAFNVASPLSVFLPVITTVPATSGPGAGSHESVTPPVSVSMPLDTTVPATSGPGAGSHESVTPPVSVSMPLDTTVPATQAPSGSSMSVAPPTSVSMPEE
jgi:YD repeat-containing protein